MTPAEAAARIAELRTIAKQHRRTAREYRLAMRELRKQPNDAKARLLALQLDTKARKSASAARDCDAAAKALTIYL
jgi:hypothetical protein